MNKIKLGNDFVLLWQIKRNGELENLLEAVNIRMVRYINVFGFKGEEIPCIPLDNGIVRVEITPEYAPVVGKYFLELHYELTDLSVADKDRKCRVDIEAFRIVPRTSAMTGAYTMSETSDLLIGLRGEKFVFADFTEEELDDLKQGLDNFVAIAEVQEANRESADQARETRTNSAIQAVEAQGDYALDAAQAALDATDSLLSNIISLEIKDDLCLYLKTPDNYDGLTFKIENGNLIAIV